MAVARAVRVGTRSALAVATFVSRRGPFRRGARTRTMKCLLLPFASEAIFQHGIPKCKDAWSTEMNVIPEPSLSQTWTPRAGSGPSERTTIVNVNASPGRTLRRLEVFVRRSAAGPGTTFVVACAMLFAPLGSGVAEATLASLRS